MNSALVCELCSLDIANNAIYDQEKAFCCQGCMAVYNILLSQAETTCFKQHPIFIQAVKNGLISNPDLINSLKQERDDFKELEIKTLYIEVGGMFCPSCADIIYLTLAQNRGIKSLFIDYATDLAKFEYAPRYISRDEIFSKISKLGYTATDIENITSTKSVVARDFRLWVALFCMVNLMMLSYPIYASYFFSESDLSPMVFSWASLLFSLPIVFYSAVPIYRAFWNRLQVGCMGMETLVTISTLSAFVLSLIELFRGNPHVYFDSMGAIITFVLLGKRLESKAKFQAKGALYRLHRSLPKKGRRVNQDGKVENVLLKEVKNGEKLLVCQGEQIPLDGKLIQGFGFVDSALLTGESIPKRKDKGDLVRSGALLTIGEFTLEVTKEFDNSTLKQMVDLLEINISQRKEKQGFINYIITYFVPIVICLALFSGVAHLFFGASFTDSAIIMITVLLISCPCAIGIAASLAESLLFSHFVQQGVLCRNREVLPLLGNENIYVWDKTGTVTTGKFRVLSGLEDLSPDSIQLLSYMTKKSIHPLSVAVYKSIQEASSLLDLPLKEVAGKGLELNDNGHYYRLGSYSFIKEKIAGLSFPQFETGGIVRTHLFFSRDNQLLSTILLGDTLREGMQNLMDQLHRASHHLLSGDEKIPTEVVGKKLKFDSINYRQSPLEKRLFIQNLQKEGEIVVMVGDGINDALSISQADIGISLSNASDLSVQVSDLLFTGNNFKALANIRALAKRGMRVIKQNFFWAFIYNIVGIGFACFGVLNPLFAALAMVLSSLCVVLNTLRLKPNEY